MFSNSLLIIFTHSSASSSSLKGSVAQMLWLFKTSLALMVLATLMPLFSKIVFTHLFQHPLMAIMGYFLSIGVFLFSISADVEPMQRDIAFSFSFLKSPTATRHTSPLGLMPLQGARAYFFMIIIIFIL